MQCPRCGEDGTYKARAEKAEAELAKAREEIHKLITQLGHALMANPNQEE